MSAPLLGVVVCTRDRPQQLARALGALERAGDLRVVVVDQGESEAVAPATEVVRDGGRGLSRARNLGLAEQDSEWVAFVDDDCRVAPDWAHELRRAIAEHPDVALISGDIAAGDAPGRDYVPASTMSVTRPRLIAGRFTHPGLVAFGVSFAVKRSVACRLGGWDERLGPGVRDFPAADDMDFVYRLLRAGEVAFQTPRVRVSHDQWRSPAELPALYRGYLAAWSGFATKHLRGGDVAGGLWLWTVGVVDALDMLASALGRRSRLRLRIAVAKWRGLAEGTVKGLRRHW